MRQAFPTLGEAPPKLEQTPEYSAYIEKLNRQDEVNERAAAAGAGYVPTNESMSYDAQEHAHQVAVQNEWEHKFFNPHAYVDTSDETLQGSIYDIHEQWIKTLPQRIKEIEQSEHMDEGMHNALLEEKLSAECTLHAIAVHRLYQELDTIEMKDNQDRAEEIYGNILRECDEEEAMLREVARSEEAFIIRMYVETRIAEIEKMKIGSRIHKIEKEMYEMRVDIGESIEKQRKQVEVDDIRASELSPVLMHMYEAVQRELHALEELVQTKPNRYWSERISYLRGRNVELQRMLNIDESTTTRHSGTVHELYPDKAEYKMAA